MTIGAEVDFYLEAKPCGWHRGRLLEINEKKQLARVQSGNKRPVWISLRDVREVQ